MAKVVDITEKLSYDENPAIKIKDQEIEVNADAATVLTIMGKLSSGDGPEQVMEMYNLIFPEESVNKINAMKLSFRDLKVVIETAINLVIGEDEDQGEQ